MIAESAALITVHNGGMMIQQQKEVRLQMIAEAVDKINREKQQSESEEFKLDDVEQETEL